MLWFWIWGCQEKEAEMRSGEDLLDEYHNELCLLYTNEDCGLELSQCGQPVTLFTDWAQCMNVQKQRTSLCGLLPSAIEADPENIVECIALIQQATCTVEDLCPDEHLLFDGSCGAMEEQIVQECQPF